MMHHRFFVDESIEAEHPVTLRNQEFHHAVRVRRIRLGETVEIFDPKGQSFEAVVAKVGHDSVVLHVRDRVPSRESPLQLTLALALLKAEKFELVLQKGTELGVTHFLPVVSQRIETPVERIEKKIERWERIVDEALKQSGRSLRPSLAPPSPLEQVVTLPQPRFLFDAGGAERGLGGTIEEAIMIVGPEGGFTEDEIRFAIASGCRTVRLGPRRLRAETAAIAAVTLAQAAWGDLRS